jgi:hypothetical protein
MLAKLVGCHSKQIARGAVRQVFNTGTACEVPEKTDKVQGANEFLAHCLYPETTLKTHSSSVHCYAGTHVLIEETSLLTGPEQVVCLMHANQLDIDSVVDLATRMDIFNAGDGLLCIVQVPY